MATDCADLSWTPKQTYARGGLAPFQCRKIDRFLAENADRPIHVRTLAEQMPLSVGHFRRAFRETFGEPPHAYVMRRRLERAQQLMLTTVEPLSHVALACGLADQAHLTKLFRRLVGASPSAWRRSQRA